MTGRLYNISETCQRLGGVHRSTLNRWTRQGYIIPTRIGPTGYRVMYTQQAIDDFIELSEAMQSAA